jgi:hypothetical protein
MVNNSLSKQEKGVAPFVAQPLLQLRVLVKKNPERDAFSG